MGGRVETGSTIALLRFAVVGAMGFVIDGGLLVLLMAHGYDVVPSRLLSFLAAVTGTWWLNRSWTFSHAKRADRRKEYLSYLLTQMAGAGINLGVFFLFLRLFPTGREHPLLPLAAGSIPALAFNFGLSRFVVFTRG